jgi:hypothetical protein
MTRKKMLSDSRVPASCERSLSCIAEIAILAEIAMEGSVMNYNVGLGFLATDAMRQLTRAEARDDDDLYRAFLQKSIEFCHSIRNSYDRLQIDPQGLPGTAGSFLSAVMKREQERYPSANPKIDAINVLEPLLTDILGQQRRPTQEERLAIVKTLFETSAADPR